MYVSENIFRLSVYLELIMLSSTNLIYFSFSKAISLFYYLFYVLTVVEPYSNFFKMSSEKGSTNSQDDKPSPSTPIPAARQET